MSNINKTVVVGMSGGVDSSVAAYLLQKQGYKVQGLFMQNWQNEPGEVCTSEIDFADASKVCDQLNIPLHKANFSDEYWDRVFKEFLSEHEKGRTPNPDILCNREIKFKSFLDYAIKIGADHIATGHYARLDHKNDHAILMRSKDLNKDQTYFLHEVSGKEFAKCIFPLEELTKFEVREIAEKNNFINYDKKDSVGICFVGERNLKDFLKRFIQFESGNIKDSEGNIIGAHPGALLFTQGQRQGLNVGGVKDKPELPWYVYDKSIELNEVYVCQGEFNDLLLSDGLLMEEMKWINKSVVPKQLDCEVQVRHRGKPVSCVAHFTDKGVELSFSEKIRAIAPGQSAVLYKNNECLGGGIIAKSLKD
ncbi:tRNA 2-thiouridine(34) synthase MnmA [Gammaproteobacteria bacterium]|nr:tRNA 2-thiouridine(34) synthase MnmA [Gammaproteobacteria bacterium]